MTRAQQRHSARQTDAYQRFARLLANERQRRHLSQEKLAERLGKVQAFVSKVERGERRLDAVEFVQWLIALGANRASFLRQVEVDLNLTDRKRADDD